MRKVTLMIMMIVFLFIIHLNNGEKLVIDEGYNIYYQTGDMCMRFVRGDKCGYYKHTVLFIPFNSIKYVERERAGVIRRRKQ